MSIPYLHSLPILPPLTSFSSHAIIEKSVGALGSAPQRFWQKAAAKWLFVLETVRKVEFYCVRQTLLVPTVYIFHSAPVTASWKRPTFGVFVAIAFFGMSTVQGNRTILVAWSSGRALVFGRCAFAVLRSTCSWWVTTYVGKLSALGQPTRPTHPFILSVSINE